MSTEKLRAKSAEYLRNTGRADGARAVAAIIARDGVQAFGKAWEKTRILNPSCCYPPDGISDRARAIYLKAYSDGKTAAAAKALAGRAS